MRKNMGKELAKIDPVVADMVVPVSDGGVPAALGYSQESGIPYEMGIMRNHYIGRTFIEPTQEMRDLKVKMKLSPMPEVIKGKKVIVIDDSIVRGTTSRRIIRMLNIIVMAAPKTEKYIPYLVLSVKLYQTDKLL